MLIFFLFYSSSYFMQFWNTVYHNVWTNLKKNNLLNSGLFLTGLFHLSGWLYVDKASSHSLLVQYFFGLQCKAVEIKIVPPCCLFIGSYQLIHWQLYLRIASVATINDMGFDSLISKAEITWAKELNFLLLLGGDLSRSR